MARRDNNNYNSKKKWNCQVIIGTLFARQKSIVLIRIDGKQLFWCGVFHFVSCLARFSLPIYLLNDNVASIHPSNWRATNGKLMNRTNLTRWHFRVYIRTQVRAKKKERREKVYSRRPNECLSGNLILFALQSWCFAFHIVSSSFASWSVLRVCSTTHIACSSIEHFKWLSLWTFLKSLGNHESEAQI